MFRYDSNLDLEVILQGEYETVQLQGATGVDLTGVKITSANGKRIALFGGNMDTDVGPGQLIDHTVEQIPPSTTFGTEFYVATFPDNPAGLVIQVLASKAGTGVTAKTFASNPGTRNDKSFHFECSVLNHNQILNIF